MSHVKSEKGRIIPRITFTSSLAFRDCHTRARNLKRQLRSHLVVDKLLHPTPNTAAMATELAVQSERAFQKQPHIFTNNKKTTGKNKVGKGGRRWYKEVGLGFRTPKTAIEGSYIGM